MMHIVHHLPGRLRLEVPELYHRPDLASRLVKELTASSVISDVQVDCRSARLLLKYPPQLLTLPNVIKQVKSCLVVLRPQHAVPDTVLELESLPIVRQLFWTLASGLLFVYSGSKHSVKKYSTTYNAQPLRRANTALTILSGYPIFKTATDHLLKKGHLSTELLSGIASLGSLTIEANSLSAFIHFLTYLSALLRTIAAEHARDKIAFLLAGRQRYVRLFAPQGPIIISRHKLTHGQTVIVHTGENIPVDGHVASGTAIIKPYPLRGQAIPEKVAAGSAVFAGSTLQQGQLNIVAERIGQRTYTGRILSMLRRHPKSAHLDHQISVLMHRISLASLTTAIGVFLLTGDTRRAIMLLVVGAPGAAGMATSLALGTAASKAACHGVLIKDDIHVETISKANSFVFTQLDLLPPHHNYDVSMVRALRLAKVSHIALVTDADAAQTQTTARRLRISDCQPNCTADKKVAMVRQLQCDGHKVAVIGDATGDAPALAAADVGITAGSSENLNLESANIIIIGQDPRTLAWLRSLAQAGMHIALQNTTLSLGSNIIGLALGLSNTLTPLGMAVLQNISTLGILFNSGRLLLPPFTPRH